MAISGSMFRGDSPRTLSADEEEQKRIIYERMNPRRRKFVDRVGYASWDPFEKPKEPMDIRNDITKRTTQELVREFLQQSKVQDYTNEYGRGALECAVGIVNEDEKYRGILDFCVWYHSLLKKEGHIKNDKEI